MRYRILLSTFIFSLAADLSFSQKFEALAQTPPMGWNSWNHFACEIDENLIKETARAMAENGMRDAGYVYVNMDDCWHGERDAHGFIQPDPVRFPSGIKALADYVHGLGMKLGIYSDAGKYTCQGKPGSQGYEYQDALQYARWEVDYLKYDWCNTGNGDFQRKPQEAYTTMRDALKAAGRPVVFSMCEWGLSKPWTWAKEVGHLWRTTGDIINCWNCEAGHGTWSSLGILPILDLQKKLRVHSGPGYWNDPDMLEVGNLPTLGENRAHFIMWAMLNAPLIVGTDVRELEEDILSLLTNEEIISLNQDKLGIQGLPMRTTPDLEYWIKPLENGDWGFAILNRSDAKMSLTFDWKNEVFEDDHSGQKTVFKENKMKVRDLLDHVDLRDTGNALKIVLPARDARVYRLSN